LPTLPTRVIDSLHFSPDDERLGFTLSPATSSSDIYSIELAAATITRWAEKRNRLSEEKPSRLLQRIDHAVLATALARR
jgi:hypothetical protein